MSELHQVGVDDVVTTTFAPLEQLPEPILPFEQFVAVRDRTCDISQNITGVDTTRMSGDPEQLRMRATEIASRAADLVGGDRDRQHGQKHDNFARIATVWDAWLRTRKDPAAPLSAHDVGAMMVFMKLARTQSGNFNIDDYVDACGYAACAGEVAAVLETEQK